MFCNLIGENVEKIVDKEGSKKSISEVTTQEDSKSIAVSVTTQPSRNMDYKHIAETFMNEKMLSNARNEFLAIQRGMTALARTQYPHIKKISW